MIPREIKFSIESLPIQKSYLVNALIIAFVHDSVGDKHNNLEFLRLETMEGYKASSVDPHTPYVAVFIEPTDMPFVWPADEGVASPSEKYTIRKALYYAGYSVLDESNYFIARSPGMRSIEQDVRGDPNLYPGHKYYLRAI